MVNKAWIENDKDITEGLISEINETENLDFFIEPASRPGITGFRWVCGGIWSDYYPTSKDALINFLRVAVSKF
jgi:hypothetical protein